MLIVTSGSIEILPVGSSFVQRIVLVPLTEDSAQLSKLIELAGMSFPFRANLIEERSA